MLIDNYLKEKYWYEIYNHEKERCSCELKDGGQGICLIGQYLEGVITAREYLKVQNDELFNLEFGTVIRTRFDNLARIIGVEKFNNEIFFVLDRKVLNDSKDINSKSNKINVIQIDKHSNNLKDLVCVGDIANGKEIIRIENGKFWYGYFGNEYISGEITELLSKKDYKDKVIRC